MLLKIIVLIMIISLVGCTVVWVPYMEDKNSSGGNIVKIEKIPQKTEPPEGENK